MSKLKERERLMKLYTKKELKAMDNSRRSEFYAYSLGPKTFSSGKEWNRKKEKEKERRLKNEF